jgi:hypothetical protein
VARRAGLSDESVASLAAGEAPVGLEDGELVAHRLVQQLCTTHAVEPSLYRQAEDIHGDVDVVSILQLAGMYLFTAAVLNAFEVPSP